jgi:hypothetical protein
LHAENRAKIGALPAALEYTIFPEEERS